MKVGGYIMLYRSLLHDPLWTGEPFARGQAWADLLMIANFKPGYVRVRGNKVPIKRGQVGWSAERLAARWQWSRGKVNRFLNELEHEHQIERQKTPVTTVLTISNYSHYQTNGHQYEQQTDISRTSDDTADGALIKNVKKEKKGKKTSATLASIDSNAFDGDLPTVLDTPAFREMLGNWLLYKAELRKPYKPTGLQTMITRAAKRADEYGLQAIIDSMETSIASGSNQGWDYPDRFTRRRSQPSTSQRVTEGNQLLPIESLRTNWNAVTGVG